MADVSTRSGTDDVIRRVADEFGALDLLVHVVGGSSSSPEGFVTVDDDVWQSLLETDLLSAVRLDRELLPAMVAAGSGAVVRVTSIQRRLPLYEATLGYAAAKAALATYGKGLSNEVGRHGVRVNTVAPGFVQTTSADALVRRIAEDQGIDRVEALQQVMD